MRAPIRFTTKDLDLFPEPLDDTRYEIINGELHVSRQPKAGHQFASGKVFYALESWSTTTRNGLAMAAPGVVFAVDDAVAPDVIWIADERLQDGIDEAGHFRVAPDLMVEILSPGSANELRDRELKLDLYSRYGVREYWIVDWRRHEVSVYRRSETALHISLTLRDSDVLTSPLLPGFSCPISQFWFTR